MSIFDSYDKARASEWNYWDRKKRVENYEIKTNGVLQMTAEELASYILISKHHASICGIETAEMLRQQVKEIEQLNSVLDSTIVQYALSVKSEVASKEIINKQAEEIEQLKNDIVKQQEFVCQQAKEIEALKYELSNGAWRELTDKEDRMEFWKNLTPTDPYEKGFIDGMQKQMQSSVDKFINNATLKYSEKYVESLEVENTKQAEEIEQLKTRIKQLLETQDYLFKQHDADKAEIEQLKPYKEKIEMMERAYDDHIKKSMGEVNDLLKKASEK